SDDKEAGKSLKSILQSCMFKFFVSVVFYSVVTVPPSRALASCEILKRSVEGQTVTIDVNVFCRDLRHVLHQNASNFIYSLTFCTLVELGAEHPGNDFKL